MATSSSTFLMANPATRSGDRPTTPEELAKWSSFVAYFGTRVRPEVNQAVSISELAADAHVFAANLGLGITVFTQAQYAEIQKLIDVYNRLDRSNMAVEIGRYGLSFKQADIDILVPESTPAEEYEQDVITGFGITPIIWVAVVGVLVVAGVWPVSKFLEAKAKKTKADAARDLIAADKEIAKLPEDVRDAWSEFKEQNKEKIEQVGLLDQLFGSGFGSTIAMFFGVGLLIYVGSKVLQGRK